MFKQSGWDCPYEPSKYSKDNCCIGKKMGSPSNSRKYDDALKASYSVVYL